MISKIKVDVLRNNINQCIYTDCNINLPYSIAQGQLANEMKNAIQIAISSTVAAAFDELLKNLYTQDDLERDLDL